MQNYLSQLLHDINQATKNLRWPFIKTEEFSIHDWIFPGEEDVAAPKRNLVEWTGISPDRLPPSTMLSDEEVTKLLKALNELLSTCNCHVVFQIHVPERLQYESIRQNFDQEVKLRQWHDGFFEFCKPGTPSKTCALGEYCQCAFYEELFSGFIDEDLSHQEERERALEFEIRYLKRKYDDDWWKYYPYHLDKKYDDENGNPHDYGFGEDEDEDGDDDKWWRS
jgi:hypothetical protein